MMDAVESPRRWLGFKVLIFDGNNVVNIDGVLPFFVVDTKFVHFGGVEMHGLRNG